MVNYNLYLATVVALLSPFCVADIIQCSRWHFSDVDPNRRQTWVAVMGLTGAGKSSFIRESVGIDSEALSPVCHGLGSCTQDITISPWRHQVSAGGETIQLFIADTPGFDDTLREDEDILRDISEDFASLYKCGITIGAMVYVHRITDVRIQRGALRSISVLREMVGRDKFPSLVLATTWWDHVEQKRGGEREAELMNTPNFWGSMIKMGAKVMRHDNKFQSAREILDEAISRTTANPLKIQAEMVVESRPFKETSAMVALESFHFLDKLQRDYSKGRITVPEMMAAFEDWIQQRNPSTLSSGWGKYGGAATEILIAVAQTALVGFTGGVEHIILAAIAENMQRYFAWEPLIIKMGDQEQPTDNNIYENTPEHRYIYGAMP